MEVSSRVGVRGGSGEGGDSGGVDGDDEVSIGVGVSTRADTSGIEGSWIRNNKYGLATGRGMSSPTVTTSLGEGLRVTKGSGGEGSENDDGEAHGENDKRVLSGERHRAKRTVMECEGELQTEETLLQAGDLYTYASASSRPGNASGLTPAGPRIGKVRKTTSEGGHHGIE